MKILIAYDGSANADAMLDDLCRAGLPRKALAIVLTVAESRGFLAVMASKDGVGRIDHHLTEAHSSARRACDRIQKRFPGWQVAFDAALSSPGQEIAERVDQFKPDLVVVGRRGPSGGRRSGLGRVAKRLLENGASSVRIGCRQMRSPDAPSRIIISLDGLHATEAVVQAVVSRLWTPESEVLLLASIGPVFNELQLVGNVCDDRLAAAREIQRREALTLQAAGLRVSSEITCGFPAADVIEAARTWNADCVFLGAGETRGFERFISGNSAERIAARVDCSIEVVRPSDPPVAALYGFSAKSRRQDPLRIAS